ncbi:heavy metal translocating P-type ATPase [Helicobacter sp. MIT 05-5294]|uniref:heavy metal translocating P-type ATPase n=1 Tax=Helicobacter sp. MIT 05-5294 TaxID=1548150 RepID=UPI00051F889E|nr:heavy metal translocating P-type ATPase [Helicobacter sp. MIT 05-5294]TLD87315.1 heavy metal translocating P-type ATPase [Helicobacter sp. MIT 05-5294]
MSCCNEECQNALQNTESKAPQETSTQGVLSNVLFGGAMILYGFALLVDFGWIGLSLDSTLLSAIFILCYLVLGFGILKEAFIGLISREYFNENTLMALASLSAFYIGESAEAVAILVFYRIGESLEERVVAKAKKQIQNLSALKIESARVLREGVQVSIHPKEIQKGDVLVVFAGERIPADGKIIKGEGSVDNSALNGESIPQSVIVGDKVLSGGINLDANLQIEATQNYADSAFSKILRLIEEGNAQKSHSEEFITKFARYYTPIVTLLAFAITLLPTFYFWALGADFMEAFKTWSYRGIIFLVVSCPCALVISIPLTFFASLGKASKMGILIKGSSYLESLYSTGTIVFDKTGTLTKGELVVKEVQVFGEYDKDFVLKNAQILESHSNHPIAKAILNYAIPQNAALNSVQNTQDRIEDFKEYAGGGIRATLNGKAFALGNARFIESLIKREICEEQSAKCQVFLSLENQIIGAFTLEDALKEEAKDALLKLSAKSMDLVMLSGDKQSVAQEVAQSVGISTYYANLLPHQKVAHLKEILQIQKAKGKKVIFVGDGINDAPSLALSDIGIAMGKVGSDVALEGADIVIMDDDLNKIPQTLEIANKTRRILLENIVFALGVKAAIMVLGALGLANLWLALFGDVGVALLALLNAKRTMS